MSTQSDGPVSSRPSIANINHGSLLRVLVLLVWLGWTHGNYGQWRSKHVGSTLEATRVSSLSPPEVPKVDNPTGF